MSQLLQELGLSQRELQDRVIERLCDQLLCAEHMDADGDPWISDSGFKTELNARIQKAIDAKIDAIAETHVLPNVAEYIENLTLQETNKWGEAKGQPVTFVEYLIARAHEYMTETVNYEGKTKTQANGFSWSGTQTRIAHLIHQHLHYNIERAMKEALANANSQIVGGLEATCRQKLAELSQKLKVAVSIK